jgi:hypothetical protein
VIVPATMHGQTISHRVSRRVRHRSIITWITAVGEPLTPYLMTSQDSHAIRKRLMSLGVRLGVVLVWRHRSKPYVNGKLLFEYINTTFVPYLNELRDSEELEACEAVVLMHNNSLHMSDDIVALFTRVRVRIITFALTRLTSSNCSMWSYFAP